ncbi:2',5'-phosphodiesterase 12 [Holothuria leucospilota]|uniref:2',5'-phosphodiesterase 12 n=1 Tax=Holothuria leucospilota TaxID=206669 RepID=A0A9Q0YCP0_HOLLE|nr:2',5'-phosphodiesterase 12 [Holothuria leucospilota]
MQCSLCKSLTIVSSEVLNAGRYFSKSFKFTGRCKVFQWPTVASLKQIHHTSNLRQHSQRLDFKMEDTIAPSQGKALVRCIPGMESMNISFHFKGKDFNLLRDQTETLERTFSRISQNFKKLAEKANKKRAKKLKKDSSQSSDDFNPLVSIPECSILHNGDQLVPLEAQNRDAWTDGAIFRIGESAVFEVKVNLPSVMKLQLPRQMIAGCPLFPQIESEFSDLTFCQFLWFCQKDSKVDSSKELDVINSNQESSGACDDWNLISNEKFFTPSSAEVGKHLLLKFIPHDGERQGEAAEVKSSSRVIKGPDNIPFVRRHKLTADRTNGPIFRVVSYNLLADTYADSDFSRDVLFPHCPPEFLAGDYRQQLSLKEIIGYHSDILCLQEVDKSFYERSLRPSLGALGYEGAFCCKTRGVAEGEAIFFQNDRYKLLGSHDIVVNEKLKTDSANEDLLTVISKSSQFLESISNKSTVAQVMVLDDTQIPNKKVIVANTHLYFHPNANHVRMIQVAVILRHMQQLMEVYKEQDPDACISLLLIGDLNSSKWSGVYELISTGRVPVNSINWFTGGKEEYCGGMELTHDLNLQSACPDVPYTNFVPAFIDTIDHIVFSVDTIGIHRVVPMPSHEEVTRYTALPNEVFPSDHLALVCDLQWL